MHRALTAVLLAWLLSQAPSPASWPVAPLTRSDALIAVKLVKADPRAPQHFNFVYVGPLDQRKHPSVSAENADHPLVEVVLRDMRGRNIHAVTVDPTLKKITEWQRLDDKQPPITQADIDSAENVVRKSEQWQESLRRRGIDPSKVVLDCWPSMIPYSGFHFRSVKVLSWLKDGKDALPFHRPIDGLVVTVNVDARRVFEFYDREVAALPPPIKTRSSPKDPIGAYSMPSSTAAAIKVKGAVVAWKGWTFTPAIHPREGLVLHGVSRTVNGAAAALAHRLSTSEIAVVYGDSSQYWSWRTPLLFAERGLGLHPTDLRKGTHIPRNAKTMATATVAPDGTVSTIPGAIAIYELPTSTLIVQSTFAVGNIIVRQSYIFEPSGELTLDVGVGGIPLVRGYADELDNDYGTVVGEHAFAPFGQVFCNFRMDLDLEGEKNVVSEVDQMVGMQGEDRYGTMVLRDVYPFLREAEAVRDGKVDVQRSWLISPEQKFTRQVPMTGYRIVPGSSTEPVLSDQQVLRKKAGFLDHLIWVTRQNDAELYSVGQFASQSMGEQTLRDHVANNEEIANQDVVVWCTQTMLLQPGPEDWPYMRMQHARVRLVPVGAPADVPSR